MLIRLCWAIALLGATCMAQNANQAAHAAAKKAAAAALLAQNTTRPPKTGNPNIDYLWDPNLPIELEGYDLSNYPFYNGLPDDLLDPTIYNFTCDNRLDGFYASVHHQCQVYHNCLFGLRYDFVCANYTVFSQKDFICQYVSLVDCKNSAKHFDRNEELYVEQSTTTTTPKPFPRRQEVQVVYVDRPVFRRPNRPRPKIPSFKNKRPQASQAPPRQAIDDTQAQEQPAGGRQPSNRRPTDSVYDDYDYDYYYDPVYYDEYYDYADEPSTTTTTTTPPPPPPRRVRPQRNRLGPGRRPGGNRVRPNIRQGTTRVQGGARPLEQDITHINKDTQNNEPEVRRPVNRRRPGLRPNKPAVRNTTPADPFYDYNYDYDNIVEEPSIPSTTPAPVLTTRRPTRPRINIRKPESNTEEALLTSDQEPEVRKPINGRRPFRPAPEEPASVPRRSGSGSVVNARQPFRPAAQESSPREETPARGSLGSGGRRGPSFPSRRKPTAQPEELVNEEVIIEETPPLAPAIELAVDDTIPEESPVEEESIASRRASPGRRVRVGGLRRRPQRQSPAAYYYNDYNYNYDY